MKVSRWQISLVGINLLLLVVVSFCLGVPLTRLVAGRILMSIAARDSALDPSNCTKFDCRGFVDYNKAKSDWKNKRDDRPCFLSNPIFGYYNTCGDGDLGLSKETSIVKAAGIYRVLLVGGSQANINTPYLESVLRKAARSSGRFVDAEVFGAAIGGGKQPMQLQTAAALIAMGYEFDAIVNINGWNEVVLASVENGGASMPAIYPRSHLSRLELEERALLSGGVDASCKAADAVLGWHPLYLAYSYVCVQKSRRAVVDSQDYSFNVKRLKLAFDNSLDASGRLSKASLIWRKTSQMLEALASINEIKYLEVVQPTLNLAGSKDLMSPEEVKNQCMTLDRPVVNAIREAYSGDVADLLDLNSQSVLDARYMFKNEVSRMFDDCVHLSPDGSKALSELIVRRLGFE